MDLIHRIRGYVMPGLGGLAVAFLLLGGVAPGFLWGLVFGYAFFGDLPDAIMLAGAAIVVASGLYILYRETRRGQDPTPPVMKS